MFELQLQLQNGCQFAMMLCRHLLTAFRVVSLHLIFCFAVCGYPHCQHEEAVRQSSHSDSGQSHFWLSQDCHHHGVLQRGQLKYIHLHVCPGKWQRGQLLWDHLWKQ